MFFQQHWRILVFAALALIVLVLYAPNLSVGFVNDDFIEVGARSYDAQDSLANTDLNLWFERFAERSLIDPVTDRQIFRPWRQVIFAADYFMWGLEPFGYHLTNVVLYILLCWVVVLLAWQLMRRRRAAVLAGVLFAAQMVHASPVISISSRGHILAALFVALCLLFYIFPRTRLNVVTSWLMCALAIGSKETALSTPALLLAYEMIYRRDEIKQQPRAFVLRQLPFWLLALGAVGIRFLTTGYGEPEPFALGEWDWLYQIQDYTLFAVRPFLLDIEVWQTALLLGALVFLGVLYRTRREVVLGLLWIPLAMPVTILFPPAERYFATASIGLALACASILAQPFDAQRRYANIARAVGWILAAILIVGFAWGTLNRNDDYLDLSNVEQRTLRQLKQAEPTLPHVAQLTFVGLRAPARGGTLFITSRQLEYAVQLLYQDRSLHVALADEFPTTLDTPAKTFFFEYSNHQLNERADLVTALRERRRCGDTRQNMIRWNFNADAEGWQAWHQIAGLENRDRALAFQTTGNDPFMGSPYIEVRPQEIKNVEIQMRARARISTFHAELFWQTADQLDFSNDARATFPVTADNASHKYVVTVDARGSAPIVRLRFDPSDTPAEIQLERITVYCK